MVDLGHSDAGDASLTGAKAANLAIARRAGLPVLAGMVLTTAWDHRGWSHPSRPRDADDGPAWSAWRRMSDDGRRRVVVRSSSTNEDGPTSLMAGVFTSVLDVSDRMSFVRAVDEVLASARSGLATGAPMAVLVQRRCALDHRPLHHGGDRCLLPGHRSIRPQRHRGDSGGTCRPGAGPGRRRRRPRGAAAPRPWCRS